MVLTTRGGRAVRMRLAAPIADLDGEKCQVRSAGISILEDGDSIFPWRGLAGELVTALDSTPRDFSP